MPSSFPTIFFRRLLSPSFFFVLAIFSALGVFYWLYLSQISTIIATDGDGEAWDNPLAVAHLERARTLRVSAEDYFRNDPVFENVKQQDPQQSFGYYGHRFRCEFFGFVAPLSNTLYIPFVKILGVGPQTVAAYSTFFSFLAMVGTAVIAFKMFGRWHAILSFLLMLTSLSWLIHTEAGHASWMPSALMMNALALTLYYHLQRPGRRWLVLAAVLVGLMYLVAWVSIVFGVLMLALMPMIEAPKSIKQTFSSIGLIVAVCCLTILSFTLAYAIYFHCHLRSVHSAIYDMMFHRFTEGAIPGHSLSLGEKFAYTFKCMTIDMHKFDHVNKVLEGAPAIPYVFALFFIVGLFYSLKDRSAGDKILLIWLIAVFGFLCTIFTFTHRYALMGLSAMSIVAARGMMGLHSDLLHSRKRMAATIFALITGASLAFALFSTHHSYYVDYMLHKAPDFEIDRGRGQLQFATWLKNNCKPEETLVVMSDPIMFPHVCLLFNAFGYDYKFVYWSNYLQTLSTAEQVKNWERDVFKHHRKIVFAFSMQLLGNQQTGLYINDWRPFVAAHPDVQPQWSYSYSGRAPLFHVFEIFPPPPGQTKPLLPAKQRQPAFSQQN